MSTLDNPEAVMATPQEPQMTGGDLEALPSLPPAANYPVPAPMPGKSVVKKPGRSLAQKIVIGVLTAAVGVTGAITVYLNSEYRPAFRPPGVGGPEVPGVPVPAVPCELPGNSWLFGLCGSGDDNLGSVAVSGSGTIFAVGSTSSQNGSFTELHTQRSAVNGFVAVVRPDGNLWLQRDANEIYNVTTSPDGTVVAVGVTYFDDPVATVIKYGDTGSVVWLKQFEMEYLMHARLIGSATGQDGAILAWGYAESYDDEPETHAIMAKFSTGGELMWSRDLGDADAVFGSPRSAVVDEHGNLFLVGAAAYDGFAGDAMIAKFSPTGDLLWSKTFGGSLGQFNAATTAPNGNIVVVGTSHPLSSVFSVSGVLAEIDQNGELVAYWTHEYESLLSFNDIVPMPDGGYAIAGDAGDYSQDALVLVVRDLAEMNNPDFLVWQKTFGGSGSDSFGSIAVDSNGDIVVAGSTDSQDGTLPHTDGSEDGVILKLTANGDLIPR